MAGGFEFQLVEVPGVGTVRFDAAVDDISIRRACRELLATPVEPRRRVYNPETDLLGDLPPKGR